MHVSTPTRGTARRVSAAAAADANEFVNALLAASRVLARISARSLTEVEQTVTVTQFRTLVVFDSHNETNITNLAEELGVNASTALRMVDRLLLAQLVTRRENPTDRRKVLLGLSTEGERLVHQVTERRRAEITRIVGAMPTERRGELIAAVSAEAANEPEPPPQPVTALGWGPHPGAHRVSLSPLGFPPLAGHGV